MKLRAIIFRLAQARRHTGPVRRVLLLGLLCGAMTGPVLAGSAVYSYDSLGRLFKVTYGNGVVITYTYDAAGNRTGQVTAGVVIGAAR